MNTIKLKFQPSESFIKDHNTYVGVHDEAILDQYAGEDIREKLRSYTETAPAHIQITGLNTNTEDFYRSAKTITPEEFWIAKGSEHTETVPGFSPVYLSEIEKLDETLQEEFDIQNRYIQFATTPKTVRESEDSYQLKEETINELAQELETQFPVIGWSQRVDDKYRVWRYHKGELEIDGGRLGHEIGTQNSADMTNELYIQMMAKDAPFRNERELEESKKFAEIASSLEKSSGFKTKMEEQTKSALSKPQLELEPEWGK